MAAKEYNYSIGYLRGCLIALVVAHHSALGYIPFAPSPSANLLVPPRIWQGLPVIDPARWVGALVLIVFNDNFFMSLMFFLSGLFVWRGLQRKGLGTYLKDRAIRLGIPFVIMTALFSPMAYYPSYLQTTAHAGLAEFWRQWTGLPAWPAGPAWFVWLLLLFDAMTAVSLAALPGFSAFLRKMAARLVTRPVSTLGWFLMVDALLSVPLSMMFSATTWSGWGPFSFQTSRVLHYFLYFLMAVGIGAAGVDRDLLGPGSRLASKWGAATAASILVFAAALAFIFSKGNAHWHAFFASVLLVLSCAASSLAMTAIFLRFARRPIAAWDSLAANSYGIYLVHYMFVSWIQYALLAVLIPAAAKLVIVFTAALALSWCCSAMLRRIPWVARIV